MLGRHYPKAGGTGFFKPIYQIADSKGHRLSFNDMVQAHVLWALRTEHGVKMHSVRDAIRYAERSLSIAPLLLSHELVAHAGDVLVERYGELISLTRAGQLAMKKVLQGYLKRIEWDEAGHPDSLFPFLGPGVPDALKLILINPRIAFGRPVISSRGISTAAIVGRINAGETEEEVIADYRLEPGEFDAALYYERYQQAA